MMRTSSAPLRAVLFALVASALGFAACDNTPAITVFHVASGEKAPPVQGDPVKLRRTAQEAYVGIRAGYAVVRSVEDWRTLWHGGEAPPLPATVDPARAMLLVGVAEQKDVVSVKIQRAVETSNGVHVWVKETRAGEGCVNKAEHAPLDAVVAARIDKPVKFYVEEERADSCGEAPAANVQCRVGEAPAWSPKATAQPGDTIECEMNAEARGKFAVVDRVLSFGEVPGGTAAKLAYAKGPTRGTFVVDVFGTYTVRAEATDDSGRQGTAVATVEALPPKTNDVLVQLVWTNFDASDDPDTFPRVTLRASEEGARGRTCSVAQAPPELCEVKTRSAYTLMRLRASEKRLPLDLVYVDERVEKGPVACIQLYFDGRRTGEACDRSARAAGDRWSIGTIEMASGKLLDGAAQGGGMDAGADAAPADAGAKKPASPPERPPAKK